MGEADFVHGTEQKGIEGSDGNTWRNYVGLKTHVYVGEKYNNVS